VDELPEQQVEDYAALDVSLRWTVSERLLTSLTVRNVNDSQHREFRSGGGNLLERDALLRVSWSF
jgi:hypothetical protein